MTSSRPSAPRHGDHFSAEIPLGGRLPAQHLHILAVARNFSVPHQVPVSGYPEGGVGDTALRYQTAGNRLHNNRLHNNVAPTREYTGRRHEVIRRPRKQASGDYGLAFASTAMTGVPNSTAPSAILVTDANFLVFMMTTGVIGE